MTPAGTFAEFAYDGRGLLIRATDRQGTRAASNAMPWARFLPASMLRASVPLTVTHQKACWPPSCSPTGASEQARYDAEGNLVQRIDPQGLVTRFEYGPFDKLIASAALAVPSPAIPTTRAQLVAVTNPLGEEWHYRYNAAGQLVEEQDFSGRLRQFDLDIDGQLLAHTDALGQTTRYRRDLLGRLIEKIAPEGSFRFVPDVLGRLVVADSPGAKLRFEFDALGRLVRETPERSVGHLGL